MEELVYLLIWIVKGAIKAYRKRQERVSSASPEGAAPDGPVSVASVTPQAVDAQAEHAARIVEAGWELTRHAEAFTAAQPRDEAERAMQDLVREQIVPAADGVSDQARRKPDRPQQLDALDASMRFQQRQLGALQQMVGQRNDGKRRGLLRDAEAVAMATYRPLLDSQQRRGFPLNTRQTVALFGESPGALAALLARTRVAPIEVSVRVQHDTLAWPLIAREVGRDIVLSTDGLREQIRDAAGFPAPRRGANAGFLTEEDVIGSLGAWQLELCADAVGALLLGPAYLAALTLLLRSPSKPYVVRLVELRSGLPTATPPADLRVEAVSEVLARVGFAADAGRLLDRWRDEHPLGMEYFYPTGGGRYASVPEDLYAQPVRALAGVVCQHQLDSIGGMQLVDVPGLHHSLDRQRRTERVLEDLERGLPPSSDDPRIIVAACALAAHGDPGRRTTLMPALRGAIVGGDDDLDPVVVGPIAGRAEGLFAPEVIRDALVFQEILERPGAR